MDDRLRWSIAVGLIAIAVSGIAGMTICYIVDHNIPPALAVLVGAAVGALGGALTGRNGAK